MTARTVMHRSHLPLKVCSPLPAPRYHRNSMSARQLWLQPGPQLQSTWLLLQKLRAAMVYPDRSRCQAVAVHNQPALPGGGVLSSGPSHAGKLLLAGAVEIEAEPAVDPARGHRRLLPRAWSASSAPTSRKAARW